MTDLSYTPSFVHADWLGGVDRVEAGGPGGLNARLHAIESDLRQASAVIGRINTELGQLGPATSQAQQITFTPMPGAMDSDQAWFFDARGGTKASSSDITQFRGLVNLDLPHGARLASVRVQSFMLHFSSDITAFTLTLSRGPIRLAAPPASAQALATINTTGFVVDAAAPVAPDLAVVDRTAFRYFVTLTFSVQTDLGNEIMIINSVAINLQTT
ncbi:hypothetical protein [Dactylosporangium sp. CA-092794]|uniref:hypothetical protein n=1 Tax=Dactylosporangium sp. CA-092794 TaxID=3239929 RepID=UPI003D93C181